ncbi:phosphatase PAP2 family protein [Gimesia sp.]|uniref:phosphatase PAP2 family protein n=1 Tax=Gimesia sp. TaxID=2024833 RepID=UPI003A911641
MKQHIRECLSRLILWLKGREPLLLVVCLGFAVSTWAFIEIADEVLEQETQAFDKWVIRSLRKADDPATPIGPVWLQETGRDLTAFGGVAALVFFTVIVSGYLWIEKKPRVIALLSAAALGGLLVSSLLKHFISRPRPDVVPHLSEVYTSSFPSGHSMLSAVIYLTLGALLASVIPRTVLKVYVISVAILLTILVGLSRIYLGVHYPTDVIAGWIAGLSWALFCWSIARWLQNRNQIEDDETTREEV